MACLTGSSSPKPTRCRQSVLVSAAACQCLEAKNAAEHAPPTLLSCRRQKRNQPKFEGDVSEWGRTQIDGFYDEDSEVAAEPSELSSAMSPRNLRPRVRSFDMEEATQVRQIYCSGCWGSASTLHWCSCLGCALLLDPARPASAVTQS